MIKGVEKFPRAFYSKPMSKPDPRVDVYIAKSADFAKPILEHIRHLVHAACPEVTETIKWGMPHFVHHGNLCGMAAFKHHCAFHFWNRKLIFGNGPVREDAMGQFGRITSVADLPSDEILAGFLKKAVELNEAGIKKPARTKSKKKLIAPDYFIAALKPNKKAHNTFENLSPSCQREYVEWITEAKREETRAKRLKTALQWLAAGKSRNWKYQSSNGCK
jgi:uncharacterized protein YdeI (YjbR/CyaY-like superfamily)